jgi:hypothetical protein
MRALLAGIQGWVKDGAEPPASQFPLVGKDQLVAPGAIRFPKIAGVTFPKRIHEAWRLDFGSQFRSSGITSEPPKLGKAYPTLLPQVDMDGNETSGIRLPDVQVPLATHAGWNLRAASIGAPDELLSMVGSYIPFARTKAEREKTRDPRPSIEERYKSKEEYLARVRAAAEQLAKSRYVLESDVTAILEKAAAQWDHRMAAQ